MTKKNQQQTPEQQAPQQQAPQQQAPEQPAGDEPTLRDGVPVLDLSGYPYPFSESRNGWRRLDVELDTGLQRVAERVHAAMPLDLPTCEVFRSVAQPDVVGVVYAIKRASGVELFITRKHYEQLTADFARAADVKNAAAERIAEARAEASTSAPPAAGEPQPPQ